MQTSVLRDTAKSIDEIMSYQHPDLVDRYIKDFHVSKEYGGECFKALKQFLVVCSIVPGRQIPSEAVDDMWHTFLLYTRDYRSFCEDYLGQFVHHQPAKGPASSELYASTRAVVTGLFSQIDIRFWPLTARVTCDASSHSGCCSGVAVA